MNIIGAIVITLAILILCFKAFGIACRWYYSVNGDER